MMSQVHVMQMLQKIEQLCHVQSSWNARLNSNLLESVVIGVFLFMRYTYGSSAR